MMALTSGQESPSFFFHHNHCGSYSCSSPVCCSGPSCYYSACCYAAGPSCYSSCCSYASCCSYSSCCSSSCCHSVHGLGLNHGGTHGGHFGAYSMPLGLGNDRVNSNGGWGNPYASYAPLGEFHGSTIPGQIYQEPVKPNQDSTNSPMKKVDDKKEKDDLKGIDDKNDTKGGDGKMKNSDGKSSDDKEDNSSMQSRKPTGNRARMIITVPDNAKLFIDDQETSKTASQRSFTTPVLNKGENYYYEVRVEITQDGKTMSETRKVSVQAGKVARVDFRNSDLVVKSSTAR